VLKFSEANAKLSKLTGKVYSLDLQAGAACPFSKQCKSQVVLTDKGRRIKDGPNCLFRCFSASQEVVFSYTYKMRRNNYLAIKGAKSKKQIVKLILTALPKDATIIRYHVGGDFFKQSYFDAAIEVAKLNPHIVFYAYTKSLPFWVRRLNSIPTNFVLTASYGGKCDHLISLYNLRSAKVVFSIDEAQKKGLPLDNDDSYASKNKGSFALLLHGTQPKGSLAAKAWKKLGMKGYRKKGAKTGDYFARYRFSPTGTQTQ